MIPPIRNDNGNDMNNQPVKQKKDKNRPSEKDQKALSDQKVNETITGLLEGNFEKKSRQQRVNYNDTEKAFHPSIPIILPELDLLDKNFSTFFITLTIQIQEQFRINQGISSDAEGKPNQKEILRKIKSLKQNNLNDTSNNALTELYFLKGEFQTAKDHHDDIR